MTAQEIVKYCLNKESCEMCRPFGEIPVCFKTSGRIFCELYPEVDNFKLTLRSNPELAAILRNAYESDIVAGYHCPPVQQRFKNTVYPNRSVEDDKIYELIDHSYIEAQKKK